MITSSLKRWEKSISITEGLKCSSSGEVYKALDVKGNRVVVMRRIRMDGSGVYGMDAQKECHSPYTVNWYDVFRNQNELWVWMG